jgi:polyketide synthase 12
MNPAHTESPASPSDRRSPAAQIEQWLIERIAAEALLAETDLDPQRPIASYGIDSMQVVSLLAQLEDWLGFRFTSNPLDEHPTIAALAQFAAERSGRPA